MKTWKLLVGTMFAATAVLPGCAVEAADEEEVESVDDALTYASLKGTWTGVDGRIYSLNLTKTPASTLGGGLRGYEFSATIDSGARCIVSPCDVATTTVSGVYAVKGTRMTLNSYDRPTAAFAKILGDYKVSTRNKVTKMKLTKSDGTLTENFTKDTAGVQCGTTTCGVGLVCCNPLMNICTPQGMMCIQ